MERTFKGFLVEEKEGQFAGLWKELAVDALPQNELLVQVAYSSINYKDALAASGNKGVTRKFPHVPGIDAAGTVIRSENAQWPVGTRILVTGFDLGMNTWGGFGELISIPADWALKLPDYVDFKAAMSMGTAGLTAALSVNRILKAGITPESGAVAVSGATGGVGSIAVTILAQLGFKVTAISGKSDPEFLKEILGASEILDRETFVSTYNSKPVGKTDFAAAVDTVGGEILSGLIKATNYGGVVTCCGMVSSPEVSTSIFPFILRGVELAGIDSVNIPMSVREYVWDKLLADWYPENTEQLITEITPDQLSEKIAQILAGKAKGRFVLKHESELSEPH